MLRIIKNIKSLLLVGVILSVLLGVSGVEDAIAEPFTLFPTFVDSFSVAVQDSTPHGVAFSTDGTKMFVVGDLGQDINEYTLGTSFDVSTASFVDSFSVADQTHAPFGLAFSPDGTKMFVVGQDDHEVNEYTLSTGFDVSTASFVSRFGVFAEDIGPFGVAVSSDGTKMFVVGFAGKDINEYTLGTSFDVSTATFVDSFSVSEQDNEPTDVTFSFDGTKMFVIGFTGKDVNEYTLGTSFDVSTAAFVDSFSVSEQDAGPIALAFSSDGTKMFVAGLFGEDVNEYTLHDQFSLFPTLIASFSVAAQEIFPSGIAFSTDGAKMFVVGLDGDDVNEYTLATRFDVFLPSFVDSFSVAAQDTFPTGIAFSTDGTKMFVVGNTGDAIYEYTLGSRFDVSTAAFVASFSVADQDTVPSGIAFSTDGAKMFVVGFAGSDINEYALSTGFDVTTAAFVASFSVADQETTPQGIAFSFDGTKMFVVGNTGDAINEYTLSTGFDISTATFLDSFPVAAQDGNPKDIAFSSDGGKMFVIGDDGNFVDEYITDSLVPCSPSSSGNWMVDSSCTLTGDFTADGNVIVPNGVVLTLASFTTLIIPSGSNLTILSGGVLLIPFGGAIIVVS